MKSKFKVIPGSIIAPRGFLASGVFCDIKRLGTGKGSNKGQKRDLALIVSEVSATVAGMFTTNQVCAAPVKVCVDTTFIIDLSRGRRKAKTAYGELFAHHIRLYTTFLNAKELLAGVQSLPVDRRAEALAELWGILDGFSVLGVERSHLRSIAGAYAAIHYRLSSGGSNIPASDKMIIAIARGHGINTFLTRDVDHFRRVPGIDVISY
jgi:predicted nucleic acid-binding protein